MKKGICAAAILTILVFSGVSSAELFDSATVPQSVGNGNVYFYQGVDTIIGITTGGNLLYLEGPLGYQHMTLGFTNIDGYALCYGPTTGNENFAGDIYSALPFPTTNISLFPTSFSECLAGAGAVKGMPFPPVLFSPDGNGCSNYAFSTSPLSAPVINASRPLNLFYYTHTNDGVLRIKTTFQWDGSQRNIDVTQTVKNMSGSSVKVTLKRETQFTPDVQGTVDGGNENLNWHARTSDSVFAWNDPSDMPANHAAHRIELRGLSSPTITHLTTTGFAWTQCPTVEPSLTVFQAPSGAMLEWNLGTLGAGQEMSRNFRYSAH